LLGIRRLFGPPGADNSRKIAEFDEKKRRSRALCDLCYIAARLGPALFIFPSG
jgi:hypothetical protein